MRTKNGFTLIEVMIAMVIMSSVLLAMVAATSSLIHVVTVADRNSSALQLVDSRIERIQMDPGYASLDTAYVGTETNFPTLDGFIRTTTIVRFGGSGQAVDYKKVTVTVTGPGVPAPVSRTITLAAP